MYAKYIFYSYDNGTLLQYFIKSSICFSGAAFFTVPVYRGSPWHPLFLQNKHTSCVSGNLLTICETHSRSKYPFLTE